MATITEYVEFNGVKTSDFNVIVSGENTFNAPARVYEMIDIPGRDGQFALDMGRYENIEVSYPCANHEPDDMATFRANLDGLRNAFLSAKGYQRLEDTFHPDEYRMAVYKSGLEAKMVGQAYASQFDLVFNCKPQRFLKSGETAVSVASGNTITNPTAFESKPLIEFGGYGTMTVNGYEITLNSEAIGLVTLNGATSGTHRRIMFSTASLNSPDHITLQASRITEYIGTDKAIASVTASVSGGLFTGTVEASYDEGGDIIVLYFNAQPYDFIKANDAENPQTGNNVVTVNVTYSDSTTSTITLTYVITAIGTPSGIVEITRSYTITGETALFNPTIYRFGAVIGNSSQSVLGNPIYVDCELGDCYKIEDGEMVFLNSYISMPNDLPVLSAGSNAVSYDNTITDFKITPRWWRV